MGATLPCTLDTVRVYGQRSSAVSRRWAAANRSRDPSTDSLPHLVLGGPSAPRLPPSPIQRLAPELLSDIFVHYIGITRPDLMDKYEGTWLLGQVSRLWRHVLYTSPRVWADIRIGTYTARAGQIMEGVRRRLRTVLELSRSSPLTVVFLNDWADETTNALLDLLMGSCNRWEDATFYMTPALYERLSLVRFRLPLLRRLHLSVYSRRTPLVVDAFSVAPSLTSLTLQGWKNSIHNLVVPWHQLNSYSDSGNLDVLNILQLTTNLRHFWFYISAPVQTSPIAGTVTLKSLRTVQLQNAPPSTILRLLHLPSLQELKVDRLFSSYSKPTDNVTDADWLGTCLPSPSSLRSLQLSFLDRQDAHALIQILRATPGLRKLTISAWVSEELVKVLQALVGFSIVPKLAALVLESNHEPLHDQVLRVFESRRPEVSP